MVGDGLVLKKLIDRAISCVVVIGFYSAIMALKQSPSMPSIVTIADAGAKILQSEKFAANALYTLKIVGIGIGISFVGGSIIGILCSANGFISSVVMPIVNTTKNIPSIALFPVFIVLMGIGDLPRVFVIIWNSAYPIISSAMSGIYSVDKEVIEAAQNAGANKWQMYRYVKLPLSIVRILEGLKISVSNGFIAIVVAEMLGATKGLGYMIVWSTNAFKYPDMYVYIFAIAFIGFAINILIEKFIRQIERRLFS